MMIFRSSKCFTVGLSFMLARAKLCKHLLHIFSAMFDPIIAADLPSGYVCS